MIQESLMQEEDVLSCLEMWGHCLRSQRNKRSRRSKAQKRSSLNCLIPLRNYFVAQGYKIGPALIYQGNMSCTYGSDEASQN